MKRRVFVASAARWVSVVDGTVRDLDNTTLGLVRKVRYGWQYGSDIGVIWGAEPTQAAALAALLADPSCPTPGPNRYDR